jgi:hypothetical protein
MKRFGALVLGSMILLMGALTAQTIDKRVPKGTGQQASLFAGRDSNPETEKRIRESQGLILTQAEKIKLLETRVKELEAELASLKAGAAPAAPSANP